MHVCMLRFGAAQRVSGGARSARTRHDVQVEPWTSWQAKTTPVPSDCTRMRMMASVVCSDSLQCADEVVYHELKETESNKSRHSPVRESTPAAAVVHGRGCTAIGPR